MSTEQTSADQTSTEHSTQQPTAQPGRPEVAAAGEWTFPEPRVRELPNGLTALVLDVPGQYVTSVRLTLPLPLRAEPRELEGVAWVMAGLLDEGTQQHDQRELSEMLERLGVGIGAGMSEGSLGVDLDVPQRHLGEALTLMTEIVREPAFAPGEVTRAVRTRLQDIEQERASAPHRAMRQLAATYYDPQTRASRPGAGSAQSVAAITRDDVVAFHREHVRPHGGTVVVAGDLADVDVDGLLEASLGSWTTPGPAQEWERVPAPRAQDAARVVLVDRPGSVQSELILATSGPDRRAPRWPAFPVLGYVIGGAPNARIDAVLREEKGYTYGIRSGFRPRQVGGTFVVSGSVRADATVDSLRLLDEILRGVADGVTPVEATSGVDFMTLTAPGRYATADALADELAHLAADGLPLTFTSDTVAAMRRLTPEDLDAAWRADVGTDWTVVVVGDASAYRDEVEALGIGPVSVVPA
ncbi:M16 family metallopeptidase [Janibacter melonis]|uniref:M16 family metallopeptidase n=1 Tax=Janibacter melonis TaxID=262209 RepID=UPI00177C5F1B|nr:insulinase family protein [Janibacter melonis]